MSTSMVTHQVLAPLPVNLPLNEINFLIDGLVRKVNDGVSDLLDVGDLHFLIANPKLAVVGRLATSFRIETCLVQNESVFRDFRYYLCLEACLIGIVVV